MQNGLTRTAIIENLQARLERVQRPAEEDSWPIARLDQDAFDAALPDHGLATGVLHEVLPANFADFPAALGFSLGMTARILKNRPGHILWVMPGWQVRSFGALYPDGLAAFGIGPDRLIEVRAPKAHDTLWAIEEALAHPSVAAVLGILPETGHAYDFTASRRFAMRAAKRGVTALVLSVRPELETASAAHMRWSVEAEPGQPVHYTGQPVPGLGTPRWHVRLLKSRRGGSGHWHIEWNHEALSFRLAAPLADRTPDRTSGLIGRQRATA
jgi:protein ImuA